MGLSIFPLIKPFVKRQSYWEEQAIYPMTSTVKVTARVE